MRNKIIFFTLAIFLSVFSIFAILFWVVYPLKYSSYILQYSKQYNLNASLVASVICVESRFNKTVVSSSGASGLMQIMPSTFTWVKQQIDCEEDIFNPQTNINAGCYYLSYLFKKYQNQIFVLACYNAGEGVVISWGDCRNFTIDQIKYTETKNYVNKVLSLLWLYNSRL